jgi:hypothetical protein
MPSAANSTELRTAIQNVVGADPIINLTAATIYSVTTLAKLPSNSAQPALPYSGYTIQSSVVPAGPPARGSSTREALGNKVVKRSLRSDLFLMNVLGAD